MSENKARVLVIEDDIHVRALVGEMLKSGGYEPTCASNGATGMEMIRSKSCDMVIADVLLPLKDGWEVIREIRAMTCRRGLSKDHISRASLRVPRGTREKLSQRDGIRDRIDFEYRGTLAS